MNPSKKYKTPYPGTPETPEKWNVYLESMWNKISSENYTNKDMMDAHTYVFDFCTIIMPNKFALLQGISNPNFRGTLYLHQAIVTIGENIADKHDGEENFNKVLAKFNRIFSYPNRMLARDRML